MSFPSKELMADYKHRMEEAKKRDHRNVGVQQQLFFFNPISPGSCFFLPHGARVYNTLIQVPVQLGLTGHLTILGTVRCCQMVMQAVIILARPAPDQISGDLCCISHWSLLASSASLACMAPSASQNQLIGLLVSL